MAAHEGLFGNVTLAAKGVPIPGVLEIGFGGSFNYGMMRISAAIENGFSTRAAGPAAEARRMWLDNEVEQLHIGHWCHGGQNECLCPQPHSSFILAPVMLVWRGALRRKDAELAQACEHNTGRSVALYKAFSLNGVVCAPAGRAKTADDPSNGSRQDQWRNRPGDAILALVQGTRPPKYGGLEVDLFQQILGGPDGQGIRSRLRAYPLPQVLSLPIHRAALPGGGYAAWIEKTDKAAIQLGHDALNGVVCRPGREPELYYDWQPLPALPAGCEVQVIGAA